MSLWIPTVFLRSDFADFTAASRGLRNVELCRESEELTLSFIHINIVLFIHSILVYCVRINVIISVPRQRDKALPGFCIGAFRLSPEKDKNINLLRV